ncbi:hypothetical protein EDB85DRAFT_1897872 [Lactarius pseudohatsudake]|nr:hypothetical protein EDB85DRAFT_1897872 [Lactarius pseudohatsudake]
MVVAVRGCRDGVGAAGCCAPCWGDVAGSWRGGESACGGVLHAALRRRGGSVVTGSWRGGESTGGGVLRAALRRCGGLAAVGSWRGGAWWVGRVLHDVAGGRGAILGRRGGGWAVEVLRAVLGRRGFACHVGAARWVGGGGVLRTVLGRGQMEVVACTNGLQCLG